ncbi:hypothetical protein GQ54DRAFT_305495 [Martensiomyces pterosporus]|nr:hypothetical protein GQ54DRAFT_305495 [Martensiomyces pterosporus]
MKFTRTAFAIASLAVAAFASLDWEADATLHCAQQSWGSIKAQADPLLATASSMLSPDMMSSLQDLLGNDGKLISNPTVEQLRKAATIFPPALFEQFAGDLITNCLATYTPGGTADPTTTDAPPKTTTNAPTNATTKETTVNTPAETTTDIPAKTTTKDAVLTSSMIKCRPRPRS